MIRDTIINCNYADYCIRNNLPILLVRSVSQLTYHTLGKASGLQVYLDEFPKGIQSKIMAEISDKGSFVFPTNPWDAILKTKSLEYIQEILSNCYQTNIKIDDINSLSIWDLQAVCTELGYNYRVIGI